MMMEVLAAAQESVLDPGFALVATAALLASLVRGFSGFGAALVFMPLAAIVLPPSVAVVVLLVVDGLLSLPLARKAAGRCTLREVAPITLGAAVTLPVGMYFLTTVDPTALRWALSALALGAVAVLASGWRMARTPSFGFSGAVGASSGFLGGLAGFYGPPIVIFWLAGQSGSAVVRANVIMFFAAMTVISAISMAAYGLFTVEALGWCLALAPIYALGLIGGAALFPHASESFFRRVAYLTISGAAVSGAPAWGAEAR